MKALHFISGLPRSGSTLLGALLSQNPKFHAGMTSPVATLFKATENATAQQNEASVFVTEDQRRDLLRGIFEAYYREHPGKVIFDTSRMWCARMPLLAALYPDSKVIACVRDVGMVLDSFELLYRRNHQQPSAIYGWDTNGTVYSRTAALAASSGPVGFALDATREAAASSEHERLLLIDYESLCREPREAMQAIYCFVGEPYYDHDFENVSFESVEFDKKLGAPGLHTVKGRVEWRSRRSILPPDLFERFAKDNFWK